MFPLLVILFVGVPMAELAVLIRVGQWFGVVPTLALVLGTGVLGASLARWQGAQVMRRIQVDLQEGRMPADALIDGLLILIAGLVLLTPGLITDLCGFALLIPPIRQFGKRLIRQHYAEVIVTRTSGPFPQSPFPSVESGRDAGEGDVVDAEFFDARVVDP